MLSNDGVYSIVGPFGTDVERDVGMAVRVRGRGCRFERDELGRGGMWEDG
jgi:hypothetical protein